jgi:beta-glucosidase
VAAGLDLEMPGGPNATGEEIVEAVKAGTLDESDLDKTVLRLLQFVKDSVEQRRPGATIDRDACRKLARKLAGECAVLMKNEGSLLPLKENQKVAFIGEFADKPRYQGAGSSHINVPHAVSALETAGNAVIYARGYDAHSDVTDEAMLKEAVETAKKADVAVIFAGLPDAFETEGADRDHMRLPDNQNELIKAVSQANPHTVVVLHGGSPVELPWLHDVPAVLCAYLGGEQVGAATVDLLYGKVNPSGHLAETWPIRLQDNPSYLNFPGEEGVVTYAEGIFVGYRYYDKKEMPVNFCFGHGLSYTQFEYANLKLDKDSLTDQDTLTVSVDVKNIGSVAGKAAVQLYVRDVESAVRRPVRELRAFEKIALQPGEIKTVTFTLDKRAFAYWEPKCHDFFVESGEYVIEIGESCRDIRIAQPVQVEGTIELPFTVTVNTTIGQLLKHPKGKEIIGNMMRSSALSHVDQTDSMGEGSERMMQGMMMGIQLGALVSYGRLTRKQLKDLIATLNA